jgi:hypothetical protein
MIVCVRIFQDSVFDYTLRLGQIGLLCSMQRQDVLRCLCGRLQLPDLASVSRRRLWFVAIGADPHKLAVIAAV